MLIIAQMLQALRLEIAGKATVDPFDVSLALLIRYAPIYAAEGRDPVTAFLEDGRAAGFIRPSSRIVIQTPAIVVAQYRSLGPGVMLEQTPRYAEQRCGPKAAVEAKEV